MISGSPQGLTERSTFDVIDVFSSTAASSYLFELLFRWTRLRLTMEPFPQCLEPLTECFVIGIIVSLAVSHFTHRPVLLTFLQHCLFWFVSDQILLKIVQGVCSLFHVNAFSHVCFKINLKISGKDFLSAQVYSSSQH